MAKNTIEDGGISRRNFLIRTGATGLGLALFAGSDWLPKKRASAQEITSLPDLPNWIQYIQEGAQTVEGESRITVVLGRRDIMIANVQKLGLAGNIYAVDSTNHPEQTMAIAIAANTDDAELTYETFQGITAWVGREKTTREDWQEIAEDAVTAARVQANRAGIPGNCTADGCKSVRLIAMLGHKDTDGVTRFNLITDIANVPTQ